jgi:hypothetical protein
LFRQYQTSSGHKYKNTEGLYEGFLFSLHSLLCFFVTLTLSYVNHGIPHGILTLSLLMSYICGAPYRARNFNVVYIDLRLATLKAVSFYFLHNIPTLNQGRKLSCGTVVCKHFASYQDYPNYRWDLIWYAKG